MKRYIVLLLSVILLFSLFAPSVSATPLLFPETKTDFIRSAVDGFNLYHDGENSHLVAPTFNFDPNSSTSRYALRFITVPTNLYIDKLHILISAPVQPSYVSVYFDDEQFFSLSYLGSYSSNGSYSTSTNNIYEYIGYPGDTLKEMLQFEFSFPTDLSGTFSFLSCEGYTVDGFSVSQADIKVSGEFSQAFTSTQTLINSNDAVLPYFNSYYYNRDNNNLGTFGVTQNFITVNLSDLGRVQYLDKIYYKIRTISEPYAAGVSILDSSGNIVSAVPVERISTWSESIFSSSGSLCYIDTIIEVDLNDYNFDSSQIRLSFSVNPVDTGDSGNYLIRGVVLSVQDICYKLPVTDLPWYSFFFNGISNLFNNLTSSVSGFFSNMTATVTDGFSRLEDLLEVLVYGDQEAADEFAQEGQQASDNLGAASDVLGNVNQPEVAPDNLFSEYINLNPSGLAILSMMTSNSYVVDMLIVVFTFALAGYIFFGKKEG